MSRKRMRKNHMVCSLFIECDGFSCGFCYHDADDVRIVVTNSMEQREIVIKILDTTDDHFDIIMEEFFICIDIMHISIDSINSRVLDVFDGYWIMIYYSIGDALFAEADS